jgi:transcriptional regulatory protein ASH1
LSPLSIHHSLITPESPERALAQPVHIERAEPVLCMSTLATETKLPSFKYLTQNDRYLGTSRHSLDYPDTCINDDDWRLNLEVWIEKNFPEKFNNLKNLLRYDKPGFELLNDAIFLTELKEQLEHARHSKMPRFTSKISKKMVSRKSNPFYKSHSDHSESEDNAPLYQRSTWTAPQSSPIPVKPHIKFPFEANYTYQSRTPLTSPISKHTSSFQVSPPKPSNPSQSSPSHRQWNGHHKLDQGVMIETNQFIHTQNHKGPNHTYTIHHHNQSKRKCISCGSDQSPCWRPSWSTAAGQLCNSCGLRYKKTGARCIDKSCCRIPAKGEWTAMKSRGKRPVTRADGSVADVYQCLHCGGEVDVKDKK